MKLLEHENKLFFCKQRFFKIVINGWRARNMLLRRVNVFVETSDSIAWTADVPKIRPSRFLVYQNTNTDILRATASMSVLSTHTIASAFRVCSQTNCVRNRTTGRIPAGDAMC